MNLYYSRIYRKLGFANNDNMGIAYCKIIMKHNTNIAVGNNIRIQLYHSCLFS